jgi:hypothetical protein
MRIVVYFINYNDSFYIPFFHKHYSKFCEKIIMYDNHSTDDSIAIAVSLGIEVRMFGQMGQLNDQHYLDVKNHCWKEQRGYADYVIVCDADEFVCIDDLRGTLPVMKGYDMISDSLPVNDITEINTGEPSDNYSKQSIFDPNHITEINFIHGCHKNWRQGHITSEGSCRLLHYRCIGGFERLFERHIMYRERMSTFNLQHNMGHHYLQARATKQLEWDLKQRNKQILWY